MAANTAAKDMASTEKAAPNATFGSSTSLASTPHADERADPDNLFVPMYHVQTHQSVDLEDYFKVSDPNAIRRMEQY